MVGHSKGAQPNASDVFDGRSVLAVIPARGGSRGIPRKNMRLLNGRPLLDYTFATARAARSIDRVIVSTEDEEIAAHARSQGIDVPFMRPSDLARDDTPTTPVIEHALAELGSRGYEPDFVLILQPTSPLRKAHHVDEAMERLIASGAEAIVSVVRVPGHFSPYWVFCLTETGRLEPFVSEGPSRFLQRQLLPPTFSRNGAIYAFRRDSVSRPLGEILPLAYVMPEHESVNIDNDLDLALAEAIIAGELETP